MITDSFDAPYDLFQLYFNCVFPNGKLSRSVKFMTHLGFHFLFLYHFSTKNLNKFVSELFEGIHLKININLG